MSGRNALKNYFLTGNKPTQTQFTDLINSVFNLDDDTINVGDVAGLPAAIAGKADSTALASEAAARTAADATLQTNINAKQDALGFVPENSVNKNAPNGYAGLDSSGLIRSSQWPAGIDQVVEYANLAAFPGSGASNKIYLALDTSRQYRWSGSTYIQIIASPGTTDAVVEGSANLYFTVARVLATLLSGVSFGTVSAVTATDSILTALGKLQAQITSIIANYAQLSGGNLFNGTQSINGAVSINGGNGLNITNGTTSTYISPDGIKVNAGTSGASNFNSLDKLKLWFNNLVGGWQQLVPWQGSISGNLILQMPNKVGTQTIACLSDIGGGSGSTTIDPADILAPNNIVNLKQWIDFSDLQKMTVSDASGTLHITTLKDKSSGGYDVTGTSGISLGDGTANNKPFAQFRGNNVLSSTIAQATPCTMYFYMRLNTYMDLSTIVTFNTGGGFNHSIFEYGHGIAIYNGTNYTFADPKSRKLGDWGLFRFSLDAAGNATCSLDDGFIRGRGNIIDTPIVAGSTAFSAIQFGDTYNGSANYDIAEFILIDALTNDSDDFKIRNYFFNKYKTNVAGNTYIAFGDSITAGSNASSIGTNDYVTLVGNGLSISPYNFGIPGVGLGYPMNAATQNGNMISIYKNMFPQQWVKKGYITICHGTNDSTVDAGYQSVYQSIVQYFLDIGYDKNKVCIVTPPHDSTNALLPSIVAYQTAVATALGVRLADVYNAMITAGLDYHPHPDNTGHALIATTVLAALA